MLVNDCGTFMVAAESAAFAVFPKAEVPIPATEELVAFTRVAEGLQKPLLSYVFYSRWFEVLGFPGSLPQLIPSWPWVALGLRRLQGHRQLPTRCRMGDGRQGPPLLEQLSAGAPKPALPFTWPVGAGSGFC